MPFSMRIGVENIPETCWIWLAKLLAAICGSAISLAYILPKERREAGLRFTCGVAAGMVFGGPVGLWIAKEIGVLENIGAVETALMGASLTSLCAWWAIGLLHRMLTTQPARK